MRIDWDVDLIKSNFQITDEQWAGYELVYSRDNSPAYETDFFAILRKGEQLYEIRCSTCSCYGCDGQFDPVPVQLSELSADMDGAEWSEVCDYLL